MPELPESATVIKYSTGSTTAVSPVHTPGDHAACDAEIARLRAALRKHMQWFKDEKGAKVCGGCLEAAPCPDAALAGEGPS